MEASAIRYVSLLSTWIGLFRIELIGLFCRIIVDRSML